MTGFYKKERVLELKIQPSNWTAIVTECGRQLLRQAIVPREACCITNAVVYHGSTQQPTTIFNDEAYQKCNDRGLVAFDGVPFRILLRDFEQ
jgi:hypothetical protein